MTNRTSSAQPVSHYGSTLTPHRQPFWGPQLPERAHLVRGACLGSCPCLHGEPELMVLKWRPDGDRGLNAAEGASVSRPLLLSSFLQLKLHLSICSLSSLLSSFHSCFITPCSVQHRSLPLSRVCSVDASYITHSCVISAAVSFSFSLCPPFAPFCFSLKFFCSLHWHLTHTHRTHTLH